MLCIVLQFFSDMIFYPRILQQSRVSKTFPALACLVSLVIWHSCYHAQTFEVCGPKIYQSENNFLPLYKYFTTLPVSLIPIDQCTNRHKQNQSVEQSCADKCSHHRSNNCCRSHHLWTCCKCERYLCLQGWQSNCLHTSKKFDSPIMTEASYMQLYTN